MTSDSFQLADRASAVEAIRRMGEEDPRFLNHVIVDRLKLIAQARSTAALAQFSVGDRVSFSDHAGQRKTGLIIRLNKKTVSIVTDQGQQWNVHPGYLSTAGTEIVQRPSERQG